MTSNDTQSYVSYSERSHSHRGFSLVHVLLFDGYFSHHLGSDLEPPWCSVLTTQSVFSFGDSCQNVPVHIIHTTPRVWTLEIEQRLDG